jgi:hypothetical protein
MNHFVVDFFLRSTLLRKFLHPSEIGNFHGNVIGIQQNCQLRGGNLSLYHVAHLLLVSYCHSYFHLFQC